MSEGRENLCVWRDSKTRSAAQQMAVDEALLLTVGGPAIRFYRWAQPAVTIGYFNSRSSALPLGVSGEIVRRWTGGGIVEHGEDVTFALAFPRPETETNRFKSIFEASAVERYRWIHEKLASALRKCGIPVSLSPAQGSGIELDRCFAAPVPWDVVDGETGAKIAGGAQRRSRTGWLHQGSVRLPEAENRIDADWTGTFCRQLNGLQDPGDHSELPISEVESLSADLVSSRYGRDEWNGRR